MAFSQLEIELAEIVVHHTLHRETRSDLGHGVLDILDPLGAIALAVLRIIERNDLALEQLVDRSGIQLVLVSLVLVSAVLGQIPTGFLYITLIPPSVFDGEVEHTVHLRFLTRCTGRLKRTGRSVQPDIYTADQALGKTHIVVLQEDDLAQELRHSADLDDTFDQTLTASVCRVSLAGEEELNRVIGVVHQPLQTIQVREEQVSTFVGGETATETDNQVVRVHLVQRTYDTGRITLGLHPVLAEFLLDIIHHLALQAHAGVPNHLVGNVVVRLPHLEIRLVTHPLLRQIFLVDLFPFVRCPGRHMYAVGHVIHMQLLREITGPYRAEHLLAYLAVEPAYAVRLLAGVERKDTHREFLRVVVRIDAAHADQVMPFDT